MKKIWIIIILTVFPLTGTFAAKIVGLYQVQLPVVSQSNESRLAVVKEGMIQLLIKLTGDRQIANKPGLKEIIQRADYYVQEYSYSLAAPTSFQYLIKITYNRADINRVLKQNGVAFWGEVRPLMIVWMAVTNSQYETEIVGHEGSNELINKLKDQAGKYGLPLIFPVQDMAEVSQVSVNDINHMNLNVLKDVSKRYSPDAYLVAHIEPSNKNYQGEWELILNNEKWKWTITDKTIDSVISNALNQVSLALVKHYVVKITNAPQLWLKLEISHISQRNDLLHLMQYLKQLTPVEQVDLLQVNGDQVEVSVLVRGTVNTFLKNATIGQHLKLKAQEVNNHKLIYEWIH